MFGNEFYQAANGGDFPTRQGHTGHEMLEGGLTHMNGRLYDPVLSRFVSADPIVQAPYDLQSLNRYSYVMNNPLYYTDPTGFSAWTDFRDGFLKPVLSIAASIYLPGSSLFTSMGLTGTSGIIAAGAVSGAITGGGRGALAGAVSAGMFSQLHGMSPGIGKIAAHGVVGGMMSEMQGGSFKSGFLAAGFTQALSPAIGRIDGGTAGASLQRTLAAAIVGGTASVIGGGKFANGAMTGAFSRLFNDDLRAFNLKKYMADNGLENIYNGDTAVGYIAEKALRMTGASRIDWSGEIDWRELNLSEIAGKGLEKVSRNLGLVPLELTLGVGTEYGTRSYQYDVGYRVMQNSYREGIVLNSVQFGATQWGQGAEWRTSPADRSVFTQRHYKLDFCVLTCGR